MIIIRTILVILGMCGLCLIASAAYGAFVLQLPLSLPAGLIYSAIDIGTLNLVQAVIQRYVSAGLWFYVVSWLALPANISLLLVGGVLTVIGLMALIVRPRRRNPYTSYARFR